MSAVVHFARPDAAIACDLGRGSRGLTGPTKTVVHADVTCKRCRQTGAFKRRGRDAFREKKSPTTRPAVRYALLTKGDSLIGPFDLPPDDYHQDGDTWVVKIERTVRQPNPPKNRTHDYAR